MRYSWKTTGNGPVDNLGVQLQKVLRMTNNNKYGTRARYKDANERFVKFLGENYKISKLANFSQRHLDAYIKFKQDLGCKDKYLKTEASATRFLHNSMPKTRNNLNDSNRANKELDLGSTKNGCIDRAWEKQEVKQMSKLANDLNREEIANIFEFTSCTGLRLNEVVSLKRETAEKALENGYLDLIKNTKGGVPRKVYLNTSSRKIISRMLSEQKGIYLLTPEQYASNHTLPKFKKSIQDFIYNHRDKIQSKNRSLSAHDVVHGERGALSFHGLRHYYARKEYNKLINKGMDQDKAKTIVSKALGHQRGDITLVYLHTL